MNTAPRLEQVRERYYSAHNTFLHVARLELGLAKPGMVGEFNHALTSIMMSALAIEAMANAMGERAVEEWTDFESSSPYAKLRLIAERYGLQYSAEAEPWSTVKWLCRLRNRFAHAKPEKIRETSEVSQSDFENRDIRPPQSKLEKEISEANARRAFEAVELMKHMICDVLPVDMRLGLVTDAWFTTGALKT
jgi:hypothetical protein